MHSMKKDRLHQHHKQIALHAKRDRARTPYLELEAFVPSVARNASKAAEGLCAWVRAMAMYHHASKVVKPKLEKLALATAKLEEANKQLAVAEESLGVCKAKLDGLQAQFEEKMAEKKDYKMSEQLSPTLLSEINALRENNAKMSARIEAIEAEKAEIEKLSEIGPQLL